MLDKTYGWEKFLKNYSLTNKSYFIFFLTITQQSHCQKIQSYMKEDAYLYKILFLKKSSQKKKL